MGRAYAIALNAFREAVRDRVLFAILGIALASLAFGVSLAWLSVTEEVRVLVDHGLVTLSWLSNIAAIFLGASFLYKEIELRTLYVILAKPISRWEFLLGRYLGIVATATVFTAVTTSVLLILLNVVVAESTVGSGTGALIALLRRSRSTRTLVLLLVPVVLFAIARLAKRIPALVRVRDALAGAGALIGSVSVFAAIAIASAPVAPDEVLYITLGATMVLLEVCVTAAMATLVSSFSTPFVTAALSLGFFLIGRSTGSILELRSRQLSPALLRVMQGLAEVFPNLYLYVPTRQVLPSSLPASALLLYVGQLALYAAFYAALFVAIASRIFRKRDLT
ncbi:MAG: hypothetical protein Q8Q09_26230 [Deltaproteobacteria bacterium]|nr:hypothetical protein [Deltaproteobacteria bacterium]